MLNYLMITNIQILTSNSPRRMSGVVEVEPIKAFGAQAQPWIFEHKKGEKSNKGKVKDLYGMEITPEIIEYLTTNNCELNPAIGDRLDEYLGKRVLVFNFSNRVSAFDEVVGEIDGRGDVQSEASSFFMIEFEKHGLSTHYIARDGRLMLVEEMDRYNVEVVGRRAITGSFAERLRKNGKVEVMRLNPDYTPTMVTWKIGKDGKFISPEGKAFAENEILDQPIVEFSTKRDEDSTTGHDEYMEGQYERILRVGGMTPQELYRAYELALGVEEVCRETAKKAGIKFKDFKIEVGKPKGYKPKSGQNPAEYIKIVDSFAPDEFRTDPDFGKQPFRNWLEKDMKWKGKESGKPPIITPDIAKKHIKAYRDGIRLMKNAVGYQYKFHKESLTGCRIVIISGSESDEPWVEKIQNELEKYSIYHVDRVLDAVNRRTKEDFELDTPTYEWRILSAHRNTRELLDALDKNKDINVIYVTVAGMSDALSGLVSAQGYGKPTIACPPMPDAEKPLSAYPTSSMNTPPGVPPSFVQSAENAAMNAAMIVGMQYAPTRLRVVGEQNRRAQANLTADKNKGSKY